MQAIGLLISAGTVNDIITKGNHIFHEEKKSLLKAGIENSSYITVDDTGMPHKGKNGYCTHIGNEFFAYFKSSYSKSRLNFLKNQGIDSDEHIKIATEGALIGFLSTSGLLNHLVLDQPETPLTNNESERDIRSIVIKRKVSAGTRSDDGKDSRDTLKALQFT